MSFSLRYSVDDICNRAQTERCRTASLTFSPGRALIFLQGKPSKGSLAVSNVLNIQKPSAINIDPAFQCTTLELCITSGGITRASPISEKTPDADLPTRMPLVPRWVKYSPTWKISSKCVPSFRLPVPPDRDLLRLAMASTYQKLLEIVD
jgi:hypothetical protein